MKMKLISRLLGLSLLIGPVVGGDFTIHLSGVSPVSRQVIQYQCDASGAKLGLPKGPFPIEYINGGGNSLALLPISGNTLVFVNVRSGSGARYVAQQYIWWEEAGRRVSLRRETLTETTESVCQRTAIP
jgi:membrane-bound inhibitor of C-type lysozyme